MNKEESKLIMSFTELEKLILVASNCVRDVGKRNSVFCDNLNSKVEVFKKNLYDILLEKEGDE